MAAMAGLWSNAIAAKVGQPAARRGPASARDTDLETRLEAALKCRSCCKLRYAPPVHMIKLTERREITPYKWVHPDEERPKLLRVPLSIQRRYARDG